ncbi:MAG: hypothetical protein ABSG97_03570 [Sedimentisphaerales bacterium]|jgi:hypothetical protein
MKKPVFFLGTGFSKIAEFSLMSELYNFLEKHKGKLNGLSSVCDKGGFDRCVDKLKEIGLKRRNYERDRELNTFVLLITFSDLDCSKKIAPRRVNDEGLLYFLLTNGPRSRATLP